MAADDLARDVTNVRFTPVRIREGYDMSEVDDLLDAVVAALQAGQPVAHLIENVRFTPVRMREGYDMADVDDFLAEVVVRAGRESALPDQEDAASETMPAARPSETSAAVPPPAEQPRTSYPDVIKEHRSWWSRLFSRKR